MNAIRTVDLEAHLTDRDLRILEDLERFRLLTTRQLQRLHFPATPFGTHATVSAGTRGTTRVLRRLEAHAVVTRLTRRIGGIKHGSALAIWQLGPGGERFLRARRGEPTRRRYTEPGRTFTSHLLAVADVAVSVIERAGTDGYDLLDLELEPTCWRPFTGSGATVVTLKPDLLVVSADANTETHSFVEVDLDTEHLPAVLRKCHTYQRYCATGSEQADRGLFPAVIWIAPDPLRATRIREAIDTDHTLSPDLFWVITPESMIRHLAPYPATHHLTERRIT